jgi:hypothetical protein
MMGGQIGRDHQVGAVWKKWTAVPGLKKNHFVKGKKKEIR